MTEYSPYPKVIFAGANEYADNTIANISISLGRRSIYEQALPGVANIELWTDANTPLNVNLSDSVNIQIKDTAGDYFQIYGGIISDLEVHLEKYGDQGSIAVYSITALGPLANLNKRKVGATGYSKEFDGTRVYNILSEAFLTSWNEVSPTLTWQQVAATATWENFDAVSQSLVNELSANVVRPGDYELTAYSDGSTNALELAQDAAQSGRGFLYESHDGDIHYDAYSTRTGYTPIVLTADDIEAAGLSQAAQWSEVVNDVTVTYKANAQKVAADATSQFIYGQLSGNRVTQLENGTDAQTQADRFLESRAYPRVYPDEITIPLHSPTITDTTRDDLINLRVSRPVFTDDLPAVFGTTFNGFVEGIKWNLTRYTANMSLICSDQSETYPHPIWLQIAPTVTWASYTPTNTRWMDL